jgi:hypothetical protein
MHQERPMDHPPEHEAVEVYLAEPAVEWAGPEWDEVDMGTDHRRGHRVHVVEAQ